MERLNRSRNRKEYKTMRKVILWIITTILVVILTATHSPVAVAATASGSTQGTAGVTEGNGSITTRASSTTTAPGAPGSTTTSTTTSTTNPSNIKCIAIDEQPATQGGVQGTEEIVVCATPGGQVTSEWPQFVPSTIVSQQPSVPPQVVGEDAASSITLPNPAIGINPTMYGVINLPIWLWIDPSIWHSYSASASAGKVSATATATPVSVTWSMGNGQEVDCSNAGTPYNPEIPASQQSTSCSYIYRMLPGGGQSDIGGNPAGTTTIQATIEWDVYWSSSGVSGGGELSPLTTTATMQYQVEQIESVIGG